MAEDEGERAEARATPTPTARMEFVDSLPGGRRVYPVETDGEIVWLVLRGEMNEALMNEFNEYFALITNSGLWSQNWGGPGGPPQRTDVL